jgi:hypothetical protein
MDYSFLFRNEFPRGVKSIFVNGKTYTRKEFLKKKEEFIKKK